MTESERRLPIKVVLPRDDDLRPVPTGGAQRRVFDSVDRSVRDQLLEQVSTVRRHFSAVLAQDARIPAVARVVLKEKALAKSHRPQRLFSRNTCPVIGGETFGNLLVSVSAEGLDRLEQTVDRTATRDVTADISTLARIEPFTAEDAAGQAGIDGLGQALSSQPARSVKFRLFRHRNSTADDRLRSAFFELVNRMGLEDPEPIPFASDLRIYRVRGVGSGHVRELAAFVGTQSISLFPQYQLFAQYIQHGDIAPDRFPGPDPARDYPLVGIIDSGTDPSNALLQAWVVDRDEEDVPQADQDNNHGSFVAGLIINGRRLNHDDTRFPLVQAKIVDVVGLPKPDTPVDEADLLRTIKRVVQKYPDVRVWNLSISRIDMVCSDESFSDLGMELDSIQQRYDVTFVSCTGNYIQPPLRGWPPEDLGEGDRVHPPADSALGLSVGSLAHLDNPSSRVKREDPSPFSRRGPGAAFLPKPEITHYGGNCSSNLDCRQVGVLSLDGAGHVAEAIGTSFSTPLVSSVLAGIRTGVSEPVTRNLAKALLVQSAALRGGPVTAPELRYRGFGVPAEIDEILTCAPWQATLILEPEIHPQRRVFARADFPIPACFRRADGRVQGDFLMTLVYDPPLEPAAGAEYCQVNVDVSLGTYDAGADGKPAHEGKIPLEPKDYSKLYERHLVEYGFKWSPVKVYRKRLMATSGQRWRIQLRLLHRAGIESLEPQTAALVITLYDPERSKPVYNDVVTAMNLAGWATQDLRVDERIRAQARR
jgi:serine protease AprX